MYQSGQAGERMVFSRKDLDRQYELLDEMQKKVLDDYVIRGLKTKWLNAWVNQLGQEISEDALEDLEGTMEALLEWVLIDFKDYGSVKKEITCECGRKLRYRYTIKNMQTGKVYKLGAVHFQEHTGIEPETARRVLKELKKIDLEKDEILAKMIMKWHLTFELPEQMEVPEDMRAQLRVGLPLLDRQEKRLYPLIKAYERQKEQEAIGQLMNRIQPEQVISKLREAPEAICIEEIKVLCAYLKAQPTFLEQIDCMRSDFIKWVQRAEGMTIDRTKRKWLVELEYFDDME